MARTSVTESRIDRYLEDLAAALSDLGRDEVRDIVEELRSHIIDKAAASGEPTPASISAVLGVLGDPHELANLYLVDHGRPEIRSIRSSSRVSANPFAWRTSTHAVAVARLGQAVGYLLCVIFVCSALFKPIHPRTAGLWMIPDPADRFSFSLSLGFHSMPPGSRDILGWWIVPLGLLTGFALFLPTHRLGREFFRRSPRAPTLRLR